MKQERGRNKANKINKTKQTNKPTNNNKKMKRKNWSI